MGINLMIVLEKIKLMKEEMNKEDGKNRNWFELIC